MALAKLPQLSPIAVQRFSPLDATCLHAIDDDGQPKDNPSAKLDGVALGHFGGFFKKSWRENDYLWGRLDGAELAMRMLARQAGTDVDLTARLRAALTTILDSERGALTETEDMIGCLLDQVSAIPDATIRG